jgi:hypothetical protein
MQQILDIHCDDHIVHFYKTTHGEEKKVGLKYDNGPEGEMRCISLESKGTYKLIISYKYEMVEQLYIEDDKLDHASTKLITPYESSEILKYKGDELIFYSASSAVSTLKPETNVTQEDIDGCCIAFPGDIDIIRLEYINSE